MATIEMRFGHEGEPFSFKVDGQEIGDILTAVNINIAGGEEPVILLRLSPVVLDVAGEADTRDDDTGAFL
jgi:hypothetical protein